MGVSESCWYRIPYASVFATLLILGGMACLAGALVMGLDDLEKKMNSLFNLYEEVIWLGNLKVSLTVAAAVMGMFGIVLLIFGILATGSTRHNVYSGAKCILGGRCSAVFLMVMTYLLNIVWTGVACALAIPVFIFVMLKSICATEYTFTGYQPGMSGQSIHCFNLTRFGLYFPNYNENQGPNDFWYGPSLCDKGKLTELCELVNEVYDYFIVALIGALIIVIALVSFLMILTTNYERIKVSKEMTDYRNAYEQDNTEMDNIISSRRNYAPSSSNMTDM